VKIYVWLIFSPYLFLWASIQELKWQRRSIKPSST
jgi:hypothetical protein